MRQLKKFLIQITLVTIVLVCISPVIIVTAPVREPKDAPVRTFNYAPEQPIPVQQYEAFVGNAFEVIDLMFWHDYEISPICDYEIVDARNPRDYPIYEVFKRGWPVHVPVSWQWFIRDLAEEHGFDERIIFGLILAESTFRPHVRGDNGRSWGLAQIQRFWIDTANIPRLTDDWRSRDLLCPYDNLITLMELWNHARERYDLDMDNYAHVRGLLWWHNTGRNPHRTPYWPYSTRIFSYAAELVPLDLPLH